MFIVCFVFVFISDSEDLFIERVDVFVVYLNWYFIIFFVLLVMLILGVNGVGNGLWVIFSLMENV